MALRRQLSVSCCSERGVTKVLIVANQLNVYQLRPLLHTFESWIVKATDRTASWWQDNIALTSTVTRKYRACVRIGRISQARGNTRKRVARSALHEALRRSADLQAGVGWNRGRSTC